MRLLAGRRAHARAQSAQPARGEQIQRLSQPLAELEEKAQKAQQTVSRLESLIEQKLVPMEPQQKRLMDCLRGIARNAFYTALAPFKKAYNNYRDDHDQFRQ